MKTYSNIGLLFNKHYFKKISYNDDFKNNKSNIHLLNSKSKILYNSVLNNKDPLELGNFAIKLMTIYPGLVLGTGNAHESGVKEELKLGFYFDYTTGLPLIPGSSVKGVLRSAFEKAGGEYVKEILKENLKLSDDIIKKLMDEKVQQENVKGKIPLLEAHIFHGVYKVKEKYKDKDGIEKEKIVIKNLSPYQTDIFFDAFPIDTDNENGKFLANDYITPHKDPLKDPNPIQFLKILPQVTFQFNFRLHDFKDEEGNVLLSTEQKKELFKLILLDLGIGAKTNVGYGQFREDPEIAKKEKLARQKANEDARKKEEEQKRKEEEEKRNKILKELQVRKEEEERRINEKKQNLEHDIKENGLKNILKNCQYLKEIGKYLKILKKYHPDKKISDYQDDLKICVQNNMKKEPKKWKRKGKDNWRTIENWVGKVIAEQWFKDLK